MSNAYPPELQELIDKQAIRDLLAAYFTAADRHDNVKMAALYHDDATDDHGSFFKGLAKDFIATLPKIQEGMAILHHNMTTANIKIEGNYAEGEIYVLAFHQVKKEDGGTLDLLIGGRISTSTASATACGSSCTRPWWPTGPRCTTPRS